MKNNLKMLALAVCIMLNNASLFTQNKGWITETTNNGKITVKSCISERTDEKNDVLPLVEYIATTTVNVNIQNCISVLKNVSKHKEFLRDAKVSKLTKTISANEWVVYYSFAAPWPFFDYDCVTKMSFSEDLIKNTAVFTLTAAPSMYNGTNEDRLTYYNLIYSLKDLKNGNIEITISGKMSPLIKIPLWMLRNSMPSHPAEVLLKIVKLANEIKINP